MRLLMSLYVRSKYVQFEASERIGWLAVKLPDRFSEFISLNPPHLSKFYAPEYCLGRKWPIASAILSLI
ncbi:hypothetical protein EXN68_04405 [Rhizobium rhizogenes]|uniref:Uncharacterized protein n=1 Tax=Rhizobium rhizogenes TaxID=359 RepID=A0A546XQ88_RHIRH|nr:hypothetical protein EXN68_04405 [Rhizobium rhizogenes]